MLAQPVPRPPLIGVCGTSQSQEKTDTLAERIGGLIAARGGIVFCGCHGGVMAAAARGAARAGGLSVGLLPGDTIDDADPNISLPIPTGMGEMRNLLIVRAARAIIAIGGGYGTLSEVALALRLGVPVIGVDTWRINAPGAGAPDPAIVLAGNPYEAVDLAFAAIEQRLPRSEAVTAEG